MNCQKVQPFVAIRCPTIDFLANSPAAEHVVQDSPVKGYCAVRQGYYQLRVFEICEQGKWRLQDACFDDVRKFSAVGSVASSSSSDSPSDSLSVGRAKATDKVFRFAHSWIALTRMGLHSSTMFAVSLRVSMLFTASLTKSEDGSNRRVSSSTRRLCRRPRSAKVRISCGLISDFCRIFRKSSRLLKIAI